MCEEITSLQQAVSFEHYGLPYEELNDKQKQQVDFLIYYHYE